jgi:hypothetical protein
MVNPHEIESITCSFQLTSGESQDRVIYADTLYHFENTRATTQLRNATILSHF